VFEKDVGKPGVFENVGHLDWFANLPWKDLNPLPSSQGASYLTLRWKTKKPSMSWPWAA
jgi:hypothetical protein